MIPHFVSSTASTRPSHNQRPCHGNQKCPGNYAAFCWGMIPGTLHLQFPWWAHQCHRGPEVTRSRQGPIIRHSSPWRRCAGQNWPNENL